MIIILYLISIPNLKKRVMKMVRMMNMQKILKALANERRIYLHVSKLNLRIPNVRSSNTMMIYLHPIF